MKKSLQLFSIAAMTVMLSSNAAYARNNSSLSHGEAQLKAGHNQEAIADFTKAIDQTPKLSPAKLATAHIKRGIAERALGKTEAANLDFKKAIELDPTPVDAKAFKNRGLAKSALGDSEGAKSDFKMAASLGDNSSTEWINNTNG
jgi:tetratricopeptide (TPR) repeat protein